METSRRGFLKLLGLGGAAVAGTLVMPEPVRRYWFFGLDPKTSFQPSGWVPVPGQPGLFMDLSTRQVFNIRDFRESDKYDTIILPSHGYTHDSGLSFVVPTEEELKRDFSRGRESDFSGS